MIVPNFTMEDEFTQYEELFLSDPSAVIREYASGQTILGFSDDRSRYCYYVKSGMVASIFIDVLGYQRVLNRRATGTVFPLYYTWDSTAIEQTLEFVAETDCTLVQIRKNSLRDLMIQTPLLGLAMMDAWGKYATYTDYCIEARHESLQVRVCSFLYLESRSVNRIYLTHQQLAQIVGTTRETVSRILAELQTIGAVKLGRGYVDIVSRERLKEHASYVATIDHRPNDGGLDA
ncbi:MAG: Crp/Fnr family transcriptional regulator [Eggerthellaceae bacterium]|jgi:CRP-like cAMP-binding protein